MRFRRHLAMATIGLVGLVTAGLTSTHHSADEHGGVGGVENTASDRHDPSASRHGRSPLDPAARGGPTRGPDLARHDALNPKTTDKGPVPGARHTPALPSRRPLAERIDENEEVEGAASSASTTSYIKYASGYTQTSPKIYVLFWGDWTATGDPYSVANYLTRFYKGVGGSGWNNIQTQYGYSCGPERSDAAMAFASRTPRISSRATRTTAATSPRNPRSPRWRQRPRRPPTIGVTVP